MLGEAHVGVVHLWTNDEEIKKSLGAIKYKNMIFNDSPISTSIIDEDLKENLSDIIPINNLDGVSKRHYKEELAVFYDDYKEKMLDSKKSTAINVINISNMKNLGELSSLDGAINILTGKEITDGELKKLNIKGRLVTAIADKEKCLSFVRYLYIFTNSIIYFSEDFEMLFSNVNGRVLKDIVVTDTYKEIIKYFNNFYEGRGRGTFIAMQKAGDLKYFGDFLVNLETTLKIGECKLFCNEYYNCENDDEYLIGIVV